MAESHPIIDSTQLYYCKLCRSPTSSQPERDLPSAPLSSHRSVASRTACSDVRSGHCQPRMFSPSRRERHSIPQTLGPYPYSNLSPPQSMYYRNAQAVVVVYDVTKASTLEKAKTWVKEFAPSEYRHLPRRQQDRPRTAVAIYSRQLYLRVGR
jgi:hypothetical protein